MSTDLMKKVDSLEQAIKTERGSVSASLKVSLVFYGLMVVIVLGYTSYVTSKFEEMATPSTVAALVAEQMQSRVPSIREYLVKNTKAKAPEWAAKVVDYSGEIVPQIEAMAKNGIDSATESMMTEIKAQYMPQLQDYLQNNLDRVFANHDVVNDEDMVKQLASLLIDDVDRELNQVFSNRYYKQLEDVRAEIIKISTKPNDKLTMKEMAEKRVLIDWMFLTEYGVVGDNYFIDFVKFFSSVGNLADETLADFGHLAVEDHVK